MRIARIAATAATLVALPALAAARPITAGASLGRIQSKANADGEASDTWQVFGRIGLTSRLSAQLELQKIEDSDLQVRSGTGLLVVELGNPGGHVVPLLVAGVGFDRANNGWYEQSGTHTEGGLGLEYRAGSGFTLGADLRLGGRSVDHSYTGDTAGRSAVWLVAPNEMRPGEYRSGRVYAAIRF